MFRLVSKALLVLLSIHYTKCQRRISNGDRVDRSYVVYITFDNANKQLLEEHEANNICGGFLVSENMVVTSGVCLKIFPYQYVIAGYNKHVPHGVGRNKRETECLEIAKKPIVEKCYSLVDQVVLGHGWQYVDIAVARIEPSFDFADPMFAELCSYQPTVANYKFKNYHVGTDVIMFGWGSTHYQTPKNVEFDLNEDYLRATTTKTIEVEECNRMYIHAISNEGNSRFCTQGKSSLNVNGEPAGFRRTESENETQNKTLHALDVPGLPGNDTIVLLNTQTNLTSFRRNGPCQNDHGGPIATWEEGQEVVFGIITGYLVNTKMECVSPYIYTSLSFHENFLKCAIHKFLR